MNTSWENEPDLESLRTAHAMLTTDPSQALRLLAELAELGSAMSMVYLANAFSTGTGTNIDLAQAEKWYRRASDSGSILASYEFGRLCLNRKAYSEARNAFERGVLADYAPSMHMLALMHLRAQGAPANTVEAKRLLERASAAGHVFSKRNLGLLLLRRQFGLSQKIRGAFLLARGLVEATVLMLTNRLSDRLR